MKRLTVENLRHRGQVLQVPSVAEFIRRFWNLEPRGLAELRHLKSGEHIDFGGEGTRLRVTVDQSPEDASHV